MKSSGQRESYSLDAIAGAELKKEKLPFDAGETIKNLKISIKLKKEITGKQECRRCNVQ